MQGHNRPVLYQCLYKHSDGRENATTCTILARPYTIHLKCMCEPNHITGSNMHYSDMPACNTCIPGNFHGNNILQFGVKTPIKLL